MRNLPVDPETTEQGQIIGNLNESAVSGRQGEQFPAECKIRRNTCYPTYSNRVIPNITRRKSKRNRTIPDFTETQLRRFWLLVDKRGPEECWLWRGASAPAHKYSKHILYGSFHSFKVHRISWTLANGPIPEGLTIDHVKSRGCTNTLCVNPAHLEPVTMAEQVRRRDADKTLPGNMSICKWGHLRIRNRDGQCPECRKRLIAEYKARQAAKAETPTPSFPLEAR